MESEAEQIIVAALRGQAGLKGIVQRLLVGESVENPVQRASARAEQPGRQGSAAKIKAVGYDFRARFAFLRGGQDEPFPRPRRGDVEDPHFLGERRREPCLGDDLVRQRPQLAVRPAVDNLQAERIFRIGEAIRGDILLIEPAFKLGQKDDREFEALALMDAQDTDGIAGAGCRLGRGPVLARLLEFLDEFHKTPQRRDAAARDETLKLDGPVVELEQVGPARLAARQGRDERQVICTAIDSPDHIGDAAPPGRRPPMLYLGEYFCDPRGQTGVAAGFGVFDNGIVKAPVVRILFAVLPYLCQLGIADVEKRTPQNGGQLDVTLRIIQDLQQTQHIADFRGLEIPGRRLAAHRHAGQAEHLHVIVGPFGRRAHQYDNVGIVNVPHALVLFVVYPELGPAGLGADHLPDAPGDHSRLTPARCHHVRVLVAVVLFRLFGIGTVVPVLLIEYVELDERFVAVISRGVGFIH